MKKFSVFMLGLILSTATLFAQQQQQQQQQIPTIEVTGSAELEIIPDEIYVSVTLREFMHDKKKQNIADIEKEFRSVVEKLKIDTKQIALEGVFGSYDYDYKTNKRGEFLNAKTYVIKFGDLEKYNQLVLMLDKKGIENIYIQRTGHSRMEEFRRQVKVEALKAAKVKSDMMLQALGKKTGEVLLVRERDNNMGYPMPMYKANVAMAMDMNAEGAAAQQPVEMQKIKLRYEVEVHFVITN